MSSKGKSLIPQYNPKKLNTKSAYINSDAVKLDGWQKDGDEANVFPSLRFVQYELQCFSEWSKVEMKSFWDFLEKLHGYTWHQIYAQARKDNKAGFGYTNIPLNNYPDSEFKDQIDPNLTIFELRVSEKARVHCFRNRSVCYICWLDKNHQYT